MEENNVVSIVIGVELFMYGYVELSISKKEDGVFANWIGIADGGIVVDNGFKEIKNKNFEGFLNKFIQIDLPVDECENMRLSWAIAFLDDIEDQEEVLESGYYDELILNQIVELIESYFDDTDITEILHRIINF